MNNPLRNEVFVSYSHRDDAWREELLFTLSPYLQRERTKLSIWDDREIKPGDKWDQEIRQAIGRARVAVLLVSKYFLASNYIKNQELPLIFSMQDDGLRIVWVPISACLYTETELNDYQAAFDPTLPLDARNTSDQQRVLVKVCQAIREAFQSRPREPQPQPAFAQPVPTQPSLVQSAATAADQSLAQDLLFCVMAVQNEWIDPVQMSKACSEWAADKSKSLQEILVERQWINAEDEQALKVMLRRNLSRHAGDAERALLRSGGGLAMQVVEQAHIPELQRSLDRLAAIAATEEQTSQWAFGSTNRYQWQALHATGSFSQVYSGIDRSFGRPVALKTTHTQLSAEAAPYHRRRLIAEAQIAGQLEHPHIVPVYDLAKRELDDEPFYVMRLLRGPTLADEIRRHHEGKIQGRCDTLDRRRLIESLLCVCHAMEYAHARGVMHLDLKPQNVALGDYREVYLLDWGLSRAVQRTSGSSSLSKVSMNDTMNAGSDETQGAIGTPAYMSPEQAAGELARFDQRTDVYGLGAILYEILTGNPPHNARDIENDFANIRQQAVPSVRTITANVPPALADICDRALALEMDDRYATVEDLAIDLRRYLDDEPLLSYRGNVEHFETLLAKSPNRHDFREGIARNLFNLGLIQNGMLRHAAAENSLGKALEHYQQLVKKFPRDPRLRSELAVVWLHLYYVLSDARKFELAEVAKRNALSEYERLPGRHGYLKSIISRLDGAKEEQDPDETAEGASQEDEPKDIAKPKDMLTDEPARDAHVDSAETPQDANADVQILLELLQAEIEETIDPQILKTAMAKWRGLTTAGYGNTDQPVKQQDSLNVSEVAKSASDSELIQTLNPGPAPTDEDFASAQIENNTFYATLAPAVQGDEREFGEAVIGPRYKIMRRFAEGGLGRIYVAYDEALHREVALKELKERFADAVSVREQFLKEARITALLDHPGIVPIYSLGAYVDARPFYAMKLVKGRSLDDAIREFHSQPHIDYTPQSHELRTLLMHMVAVCNTLAYAHSNGILHCDIKTANVLLGAFGETYVIDWGLARTFSQSAASDATHPGPAPSDSYSTGQLFGTPAFMSPEQAEAKVEALDQRSDIFSLGVVLYVLLVGGVPGPQWTQFGAGDLGTLVSPEDELSSPPGQPAQSTSLTSKPTEGTLEQVLKARINGEFAPPRQVRSDVPISLESICLKAMALRPEDRYASALELAEDIERWLTGSL